MSTSDFTRIRRSQRDYTLAFKLEVIAKVERGDFTYIEAQRRFGIQGKSTVLVWLRKYGNLDWKIPIVMQSPNSKIRSQSPGFREEAGDGTFT